MNFLNRMISLCYYLVVHDSNGGVKRKKKHRNVELLCMKIQCDIIQKVIFNEEAIDR